MNKTGSLTLRFVLAGIIIVIIAGGIALYGTLKKTACPAGAEKLAGHCLPAGQCVSPDGFIVKCSLLESQKNGH